MVMTCSEHGPFGQVAAAPAVRIASRVRILVLVAMSPDSRSQVTMLKQFVVMAQRTSLETAGVLCVDMPGACFFSPSPFGDLHMAMCIQCSELRRRPLDAPKHDRLQPAGTCCYRAMNCAVLVKYFRCRICVTRGTYQRRQRLSHRVARDLMHGRDAASPQLIIRGPR